jgi:hypothetical protein
MFFVSILTSDRARDPELWAVIWQGKAPPTLKLHAVYNLAGNKRIYIWEGENSDDLQFMDRFNHVGLLETYPAFDRTDGWQYAFEGDLDAFRAMLEKAGTPSRRIEAAMDLRTRGHQARTTEMAIYEAREWSRRQTPASS